MGEILSDEYDQVVIFFFKHDIFIINNATYIISVWYISEKITFQSSAASFDIQFWKVLSGKIRKK